MIIYKPLNLKFANRLEAKRYFGHTEFNKLIKNSDNFEFINNDAIYYENLRNYSTSKRK
jgi:hypothetical protein